MNCLLHVSVLFFRILFEPTENCHNCTYKLHKVTLSQFHLCSPFTTVHNASVMTIQDYKTNAIPTYFTDFHLEKGVHFFIGNLACIYMYTLYFCFNRRLLVTCHNHRLLRLVGSQSETQVKIYTYVHLYIATNYVLRFSVQAMKCQRVSIYQALAFLL